MRRKSTPNEASAASAEPQVSVAAGAAARLSPQPTPDLLSVIEAYKVGMADFNRESSGAEDLDEPEGLADRTYGKPMETLQGWACAARNRNEALAALRLANSEIQKSGCEQIVANMVAASLQFLEATDAPAADVTDADKSKKPKSTAAAVTHIDSGKAGKAYDAAREVSAITYLMRVALEAIDEGRETNALPHRICDFVRVLNMLEPRLDQIEETLDLVEHRSMCAERNGPVT